MTTFLRETWSARKGKGKSVVGSHHISLRIRSPKSLVEWSQVHFRGLRTSDPLCDGSCTEMSLLVSMLFQIFLNPLKFLKKIFNIL